MRSQHPYVFTANVFDILFKNSPKIEFYLTTNFKAAFTFLGLFSKAIVK